jgi:hypothetical protein
VIGATSASRRKGSVSTTARSRICGGDDPPAKYL